VARKWSTWNDVSSHRSATSTTPGERTSAATRMVALPRWGTTTGRSKLTWSKDGGASEPVTAITTCAIASSPSTAANSRSPWYTWSSSEGSVSPEISESTTSSMPG